MVIALTTNSCSIGCYQTHQTQARQVLGSRSSALAYEALANDDILSHKHDQRDARKQTFVSSLSDLFNEWPALRGRLKTIYRYATGVPDQDAAQLGSTHGTQR
jgi:hypothetical protein